MLYKLVDSSSFFNEDEVQVSLLNLKDYSSLGMEKTAADDRISTYVREVLVPQPDKFYLHINAMGAGEYYGSNKNADFFPEELSFPSTTNVCTELSSLPSLTELRPRISTTVS